jgi:hypothetical protein
MNGLNIHKKYELQKTFCYVDVLLQETFVTDMFCLRKRGGALYLAIIKLEWI